MHMQHVHTHVGPIVFHWPWNFQLSSGIWPLMQNFPVSEEFSRIVCSIVVNL